MGRLGSVIVVFPVGGRSLVRASVVLGLGDALEMLATAQEGALAEPRIFRSGETLAERLTGWGAL